VHFKSFVKDGNLIINSAVFIREDATPRMKWTVGIVENLHCDADGLPRSADVKTISRMTTRASQKLCNVEIDDSVDFHIDSDTEGNVAGSQVLDARGVGSVAQSLDTDAGVSNCDTKEEVPDDSEC